MIVDFEYAGERLSDYGLIIASVDGSSGANVLEWGSQIEFQTIQNKITGINYVTNTGYSDVYSTTFQVIKYSCRTGNMEYLTDTEFRYLVKWLNRKRYQNFSPISNNEEFCGYHFYGSFNVKPIVIGGNIIGAELTFTSNAPYAFGDTVNIDITTDSFDVYCISDEIGQQPIKMTVKTSKAGQLTISNSAYDQATVIKNCAKDETITIDSENLIITSNNSTHKKLYNDFNYTYPKLINDYDNSINTFTLSMPCEVHLEYRPIRKVGVVV